MANKQNYIRTIQRQSQAELLKYYQNAELRIRNKLQQAIDRGNDTTHLRNIQRNVNSEITKLDNLYKRYSVNKIGQIYEIGDDVIKEEVKTFTEKHDLQSKSFSALPKEALKTLSDNTYQSLSNITTVMGRRSDDFLRKVGLQSAGDVVIGSKSVDEVARELTQELNANNFFHITYANGTRMPARAYSDMVARTTSAEAYREGSKQRILSTGYDLVDVIGTSRYPGSPCIPFQGKTLSLDGSTKGYQTVSSAESQGLHHPNCVHDYGLSEKNLSYLNDES